MASLWAFSMLFIFTLIFDSWYWKSAFSSVSCTQKSKKRKKGKHEGGKNTKLHIPLHTLARVAFDATIDHMIVSISILIQETALIYQLGKTWCSVQNREGKNSTFLSLSKMVWSRCCRSLFRPITSSFSWLMRMKLSVPPESTDWAIELLQDLHIDTRTHGRQPDDMISMRERQHSSNDTTTTFSCVLPIM